MDQEDGYLWDLEFWENDTGNRPVQKILKKLDATIHANIVKKIDKTLRKRSFEELFKTNDLEDLKNGLWELKITTTIEFRFFVVRGQSGAVIVLNALHGYQKKDQRIRNKEIATALLRLKEFNKQQKI
jgi:phage-related protein